MKEVLLTLVILFAGISTLHAKQVDNIQVVNNTEQTKSIWIDTDIALGQFGGDVDDGIALIMALRSPGVQIEGISLVSNVDHGARISQAILDQYKNTERNIPVVKGASNAEETGKPNKAVEALARALEKQKMTLVALGPATNIASLLLLHPELKSQINQIVWCAGRTPGKHFNPGDGNINVCDCNFDHDPSAGQILMNSGIDIILSGFEPASDIYLTQEDLRPLKISPDESDRWLYQELMNWMKLWEIFFGVDGFIPFDAVTIGSLLYPEWMLFKEEVPVAVKEQKNDSPLPLSLSSLFKTKKPYLLASKNLTSSNKADYCYKAQPKFKEIILELLIDE